jgi:hypothetical protein
LGEPAAEFLACSKRYPAQSVILEPQREELGRRRQAKGRVPDMLRVPQRATLSVTVERPRSVLIQRLRVADSMGRRFDQGSAAVVSSPACGTATRSVQSACVAALVVWLAALESVEIR